MDDLVDRIARALVPLLCGSQEDQHGRDLPDKQYDDLSPDWQEAHRGYAMVAIDAAGITRLTAERDAALAHAERLAGALTGAEAALAAGVAAVDAYNAENSTHLCGGALFGMAKALGTARAALASWQERG